MVPTVFKVFTLSLARSLFNEDKWAMHDEQEEDDEDFQKIEGNEF